MKNIFLICPVRGVSDEEKAAIKAYVDKLEALGHRVYWPARDTNQDDPIGLRICTDNRWGIRQADEIHIWWNPASEGSRFDFGMVFALEKKVIIANREAVTPTPGKSFANVLLAYSERWA